MKRPANASNKDTRPLSEVGGEVRGVHTSLKRRWAAWPQRHPSKKFWVSWILESDSL